MDEGYRTSGKRWKVYRVMKGHRYSTNTEANVPGVEVYGQNVLLCRREGIHLLSGEFVLIWKVYWPQKLGTQTLSLFEFSSEYSAAECS